MWPRRYQKQSTQKRPHRGLDHGISYRMDLAVDAWPSPPLVARRQVARTLALAFALQAQEHGSVGKEVLVMREHRHQQCSLRDPSSSSMTGFFARPDETARI